MGNAGSLTYRHEKLALSGYLNFRVSIIAMTGANINEIFWMVVLTILCIACFPINPIILTGLIEPGYYLPLSILGWMFLGSWYIACYGADNRVSAQRGCS